MHIESRIFWVPTMLYCVKLYVSPGIHKNVVRNNFLSQNHDTIVFKEESRGDPRKHKLIINGAICFNAPLLINGVFRVVSSNLYPHITYCDEFIIQP